MAYSSNYTTNHLGLAAASASVDENGGAGGQKSQHTCGRCSGGDDDIWMFSRVDNLRVTLRKIKVSDNIKEFLRKAPNEPL